jgi:23S rRNA (cytosine1962-C5)-methyltransferase
MSKNQVHLEKSLELAWQWRERLGYFQKTQALRVFHGSGEGSGDEQNFAVDFFSDHYWVTEWQNSLSPQRSEKVLNDIVSFYRQKGARSIVGLSRPEKGVAPESRVFWGTPTAGRFEVSEGPCKILIQLEKTRHPGLFLDHEPLRRWLIQNSKGWRVLNTFAYTGSLSVAAGVGGAQEVTTLDLSKATLQWAKENFILNGLPEACQKILGGDVFEYFPRLKRERKQFDCIILDPPSFSHGKAGRFSTSQDLKKLHALAMDVLAEDGILITSINSANVSHKKYEADVLAAALEKKMEFQVVRQIDLPETFPTRLGQSDDRYLKGWILRRV